MVFPASCAVSRRSRRRLATYASTLEQLTCGISGGDVRGALDFGDASNALFAFAGKGAGTLSSGPMYCLQYLSLASESAYVSYPSNSSGRRTTTMRVSCPGAWKLPLELMVVCKHLEHRFPRRRNESRAAGHPKPAAKTLGRSCRRRSSLHGHNSCLRSSITPRAPAQNKEN